MGGRIGDDSRFEPTKSRRRDHRPAVRRTSSDSQDQRENLGVLHSVRHPSFDENDGAGGTFVIDGGANFQSSHFELFPVPFPKAVQFNIGTFLAFVSTKMADRKDSNPSYLGFEGMLWLCSM